MHHRPVVLVSVLSAVFVLAACATPAREPWPSPTPSSSTSSAPASKAMLALSPVPLTVAVPLEASQDAWVAPLTGDFVDALAPSAAVQVLFRPDSATDAMVANVFWFTIDRYNEVMAGTEAPKGKEIGIVDGHVLFVQPALDMPFDPTSREARHYGTLVEHLRGFRWFATRDPDLLLLRPCPVPANWPTTPVATAVRQVVIAYFTEQDLLPVRILGDAWALDVDEQSAGTHDCANPDGGIGGYSGAVPATSTEAVMVHVRHAPYPVTGAAETFVTLARDAAGGWSVVGEGTGP